jgi:ectonucleotide pyrophosphatase/phosphodiesterase family protein 1/3
VSLDGFRSDYFNRGLTPYLCSLASSGVRAKFLQSQFPTKTFPNHYSIVTGLYPESHGIVHNRFYDPILNDTFSIGGNSSDDPRWWNEGEPIWVTAKKQQVKTATFFWPGSDVEIRKMRPDYWHRYNSSVPWSDRVKAVLEWLDLPDSKRPSFIAMYVEEPDHTGHTSGPQSQEVN